MSNNAFRLQIISPASVVLDESVAMVEIPGAEGDFGVLPNHAPFFSMLKPGVITVHMVDGGHRRRFFAAAGYADVSRVGTTVLSDHIQDVNDITMDDAAEALKAAREAVASAENDDERTKADALLYSAEALFNAVNGH